MGRQAAITNRGSKTLTDQTAIRNLEPYEPEHYDETPLTHIYFALDREAAQIKVGITGNLNRRLVDLSRERGRTLELLGTMRGGYNLERAMHGRFRPYRAEGKEWYSSEIVADVAKLLAA